MAKENKKAALSMEERLDAALVPDWEQPYKVPANWCWTKMDSVAQWGSGGTPSRRNPDYYGGQIPWVKTGELNDDYIYETEETITEEGLKCSSAKLYPINTIIIAMYGATVGKVGILGVEATTNQACACGVCSSAVNYQYLFYYAWSQKDIFIDLARGGAQPNISQEIIKNHPIPIPPLAEQQRIVDRIESLFAKLDEAKEKAQEVVDGYDARRAAILHKAFTGELTAEWRIINGIGNDSWKTCKFDDCINVMQNGLAKRKGDSGEPYVVLRLANLSEDGFDENDLREIVLDEKEQKSYELHSDDVLMVRVNGSKDNVGKQYQITSQKKWAFCDHIIRIRYANNVLPEYMVYYSKSSKYRQYIKENMVSTAGQNTISRKGMARLQVPIPTIGEQERIASILTDLFEKERQAVEASRQVIDQIDNMKKSILARAFRGELGTNDPTDESAIELLKETLNIEKAPTKRAKAVVIPKGFSANLETELEKKIIRLFYQKDTKELPIKDIITVSSKTFDVLDCLRGLERRQLITKLENGNYRLMG